MSSSAMSVVRCCCWIFLGLSSLVATVDAIAIAQYPCKPDFSGKKSVRLCYNGTKPSNLEHGECTDASQGLVLMPLVLAPEQFYSDCQFHLVRLYNVSCLGQQMGRQEEYDRVVFNILDKVSGQRRVPPEAAMERFPVTVEKDGKETEGFSKFVSFRRMCKSVDLNSSDVINLCSNRTKNGTLLLLTLRGLTDIPDTPSMCQCVLRPLTRLKLSALDVRLQNASNRQCGQSALRIETNQSRQNISCHKLSALYGNQELYSSDSPEEVTLTLTYISRHHVPTSVWINAQDGFQQDVKQEMSISCGGFIPLPTKQPKTGNDEDDDDDDDDGNNNGEDDREEEEDKEAADAGTNTTIIAAAVAGTVLLIVLIIVAVVFRRRCSGSFSGGTSSCSPCCRQEEEGDDLIIYKAVPMKEPVYAEPGKPRPSATCLPYFNPADAKYPDGRAIYAEPDPNGTLSLAARATTPPPIPEVPPPGSPPTFPPGTPPPKPERTLLRPRKQSTTSNPPEEDYDHIIAGGKTPLKSPRGRDGQNNIIGDGEGDVREDGNVYDCLRHGDDYSELGEVSKQPVVDNVYNTTA